MDISEGLLHAVFSQTGFGTLVCIILVAYLLRRQDKKDAADEQARIAREASEEARNKANMDVIIANTKAQTENAAAQQAVSVAVRELAAKFDTFVK